MAESKPRVAGRRRAGAGRRDGPDVAGAVGALQRAGREILSEQAVAAWAHREPGVFYRELVRGALRGAQVEVAREFGCACDGDIAAGLNLARGAGALQRCGCALLDGWARDRGTAADHLSAVYQALLEYRPVIEGRLLRLEASGTFRTAGGSWFTPRPVAEGLLDLTLEPVLREGAAHGGEIEQATVCDPACGAGVFLAAAAERLARRLAETLPQSRGASAAMMRVLEHCIHGVDVDPASVELCRLALWLLAPRDDGAPWMFLAERIRCADALTMEWRAEFGGVLSRGGFDVVVGNPPFLNRLESATAQREQMLFLRERFGGLVACYADAATAFLVLGAELVREGGRLAMIQPQSLLAARDAGAARCALAATHAIESVWFPRSHIFSASVHVCAPVLVRGGARRGMVARHGDRFEERAALAVDMDVLAQGATGWSPLVSDLLGVPRARVRDRGVLADIAELTADFRDQYYGLRGAVVEHEAAPVDSPRLVSTGLIDLARCAWGERSMRFAGRRYQAPRIDLALLDGSLRRWALARLRPKVLLATQTRVIEAAVDERGDLLPLTPLITVVARCEDHLWRAAAALCAPPVSAIALERHAGAALSATAIKLSAKQAGMLPLPADEALWDEGAAILRAASGTSGERAGLLERFGCVMCAAYGVEGVEGDRVMQWWMSGSGLERAERRSQRARVVRG